LTPQASCFQKRMMDRIFLHLVDGNGTPLSPHIQSACEAAFRWVLRDYPEFDQAQISNWAEEVGKTMQLRGSAIMSPKRYAYVALGGKVRDWLRTAAAKEELKGIGLDLERIGGVSESFAERADTKVLFEQLRATLSDRDRAILVLILRDKSTTEIATFLDANYATAAKAIQRVKDRISAAIDGNRHKGGPRHRSAQFCETEG
jgi:DNA-binding CsgD family transcriptional regulator